MKKKFYLSLFSLLFMGSILTAQNFQMKKWVLNNQTVDLSVEPPVVVSGLPQFAIFTRLNLKKNSTLKTQQCHVFCFYNEIAYLAL